TPNLDTLAGQGVRFANVYAPVPLTLPSHASILTGLTPPSHGVRNNGSYFLDADKVTLAEVLKEKGYTTAAFVASFSVDSRFGLDQGFDRYDDDFQAGSPFKALNAERKAEQVFETFSAWLKKEPQEPFLAWVHLFDPHLPYNPPSPYSEKFADQPYDGEVAYMDYIVGLIIGQLRERGILARTVVAVAGDHGEAFNERGEAGHGVFLYDMVLRVPLLFYAEGRLPAGRVVGTRVRLVDVLPTVLDLLTVVPPAGVEGVSLVPDIEQPRRKDLDVYIETRYPEENFGWAPLVGLVADRWKLIHAPQDELYDLAKDPGEERNLAAAEPRVASNLRTKLQMLLASGGAEAGPGPRTLSAAEQARLRSLGYVDYKDPTAASGPPADPKDKLDELRMVQDAERAELDGDFAKAVDLHTKMLTLRPGAASSYVNLALAQARLKDFDAAVATLKRGLEKIPGSELLLTRLGYTYLVTGRAAEALETMSEVLQVNPRSVDALTALAAIHDNLGRKDESRSYFERALAIEPENKFLRTGYAGNLASTGRLADAITVYEALVKDYPTDISLHRLLGIAYGMGGEYDKAIASFKEITYIKPNPDAYFNLALSYRQKGDLAEAIRNFDLYLQDTAGEPEAKVATARAERERLQSLLGR
ncbi:MAG: sulfatase-like hydrolase/transferase, partial [Candidatus Aminicenantes bacterium]|nr:sulfatase-like hydrolase/transferase [Candidatus Aminicenantes bacterium]